MEKEPLVSPFSMRPWLPDELPAEGQRGALHRLADALRQTIEVLIDSDAPEEELTAAAERAEEFAARLGRGERRRVLHGFAETSTSGDPAAFFDSSPLLGRANPIAPPISLWMEKGETRGTATYGIAYEGPPGHVHGGFIAASFDEVLGMAQSATGNPGMTGTLTVRYRHPTPLYREVRFSGRVDRSEGRKIFTSAELYHGDTLCAEAEAIFISVGHAQFRAMAERAAEAR